MSALCSSACGWCGMCTAAWEGPDRVSVACVQCQRDFDVRMDERPPYRCERCCQNNAEREQHRLDQDVA
jgi:hypothetical protein